MTITTTKRRQLSEPELGAPTRRRVFLEILEENGYSWEDALRFFHVELAPLSEADRWERLAVVVDF